MLHLNGIYHELTHPQFAPRHTWLCHFTSHMWVWIISLFKGGPLNCRLILLMPSTGYVPGTSQLVELKVIEVQGRSESFSILQPWIWRQVSARECQPIRVNQHQQVPPGVHTQPRLLLPLTLADGTQGLFWFGVNPKSKPVIKILKAGHIPQSTKKMQHIHINSAGKSGHGELVERKLLEKKKKESSFMLQGINKTWTLLFHVKAFLKNLKTWKWLDF